MQIGESLDRYWPDLEQEGKLSKSTEKLEKWQLFFLTSNRSSRITALDWQLTTDYWQLATGY